ncbi:hypothetical protein ACU5CE_29240 [Priestia megaterium]|uniref:hypothetical protein n=1 Tax=Priestia megaterium TaxID=1404 RepID=UPI00406BDC0F
MNSEMHLLPNLYFQENQLPYGDMRFGRPGFGFGRPGFGWGPGFGFGFGFGRPGFGWGPWFGPGIGWGGPWFW